MIIIKRIKHNNYADFGARETYNAYQNFTNKAQPRISPKLPVIPFALAGAVGTGLGIAYMYTRTRRTKNGKTIIERVRKG